MWLWTVVIITTDATGAAGEIHDRTPLILPPTRIDDWLDPGITDTDEVKKLLRERLNASADEHASLAGLVASQIDLSISRLLAPPGGQD